MTFVRDISSVRFSVDNSSGGDDDGEGWPGGSLTSVSNSIADMNFKGWDFCLAGQGAGEDPKREKSA